ncbi:uncharacterized protein LOC113005255 isoform X2 [Solenopsis invicta]|uniref:uncharacterized protein LOC113005255 isoform X2 n=1 Tax=Solenopsis invicta TaxID=13686 RepID=UPI00193E902C|nr:uncharacterized protein LOC113005255 isoform X2 [Solenopsis invicta]
MCFGSLNNEYIVFYEMTELHKRSIGERRLRRYAKAEADKIFAHILEDDEDILNVITADSVINSHETQDISQDSINNISESAHSNENLQLSRQINDDNNSEYVCMRHDLLASIESDSNSSDEDEEDNDEDNQVNFRQWLREWNLKHNITVEACRELLAKLKPYHPDLPLDPRTLNKTPRVTSIVEFGNGSYVHIGLIPGLERRLQNCGLKNFGTNKIGLDVNIDGINMTKSCVTDVWPILCRSLDLIDDRPFVVGIFVGSGKPDNVNKYLQDFILEVLKLKSDGLVLNGVMHEVYIRCFICDAPARQYLKCIVGHGAYHACERCTQSGEYEFHRMCYSTETHTPRSDKDFVNQSDPEHHTGISPLLILPVRMVTQFVLDPFHLVLEGVTKRFMTFILKGTKSGMRLTAMKIAEIAERMKNLRAHIPSEFARKPRKMGLNELGKWKGTEWRLFLFYVGCIVLNDILPPTLYNLFLMLQCAMIILSTPRFSKNESYIHFAQDVINNFVKICAHRGVFDKKFVVYNVHNLLHLCDDVKNFGVLTDYSAFPFESYLGQLKKLLRAPSNPLQQLTRRLAERDYLYEYSQKSSEFTPGRQVLGKDEYKILSSSSFTLSTVHKRDRYFLYEESIATAKSIQKLPNGNIVIIANVCDIKENYFTYPCESIKLGIYNLGEMSWNRRNVIVPIEAVKTKYTVLPCNTNMIAIPMLHSF